MNWIKQHVKPYVNYKPDKDDVPDMYDDISLDNSLKDNVESLKENTEVGFKITFKF
jgi:hypothetical protein